MSDTEFFNKLSKSNNNQSHYDKHSYNHAINLKDTFHGGTSMNTNTRSNIMNAFDSDLKDQPSLKKKKKKKKKEMQDIYDS